MNRYTHTPIYLWASQFVLVIKIMPANAGDIRDVGSIPGLGRSPGEGNGKPLQHSCLENPKDRGAWWAMVHRIAKRWTQLKQLSTHACTPALTCFPSGSDSKESVSAVSESPAGDPSLIPGSGRSFGAGNGYPLQCSYLENSMDRGAWQVTVHGFAKSGTQLSN